jgi:putative Mg2+ transporter-C (MgtC) family protein
LPIAKSQLQTPSFESSSRVLLKSAHMNDIWRQLIPNTAVTALSLTVLVRLIVAAILGGLIGLEREARHKPAGLRTQMFICIGAAFFTVLSGLLAGSLGGDHTRIAAQIIPGIGFLGAGSILHSRGSVTGLTTAATMFVVASIGMAVGGGFFLAAAFATLLLFVALHVLGILEARYSLKAMVYSYEVLGPDLEDVMNAVNGVLSEERQNMQTVHISRIDHLSRVQFTVDAVRREHEMVLQRLRQSHVFTRVLSSATIEQD